MEYAYKEQAPLAVLPGRGIQKLVGKDSMISSEKMTVGFGSYRPEYGPMEPHNHAEETVVITDAKNAWVRYGNTKDNLDQKVELRPGTTLHFDELEWHVFEFADDGFLDIIFIYGQTDNIRPEEIEAKR